MAQRSKGKAKRLQCPKISPSLQKDIQYIIGKHTLSTCMVVPFELFDISTILAENTHFVNLRYWSLQRGLKGMAICLSV